MLLYGRHFEMDEFIIFGLSYKPCYGFSCGFHVYEFKTNYRYLVNNLLILTPVNYRHTRNEFRQKYIVNESLLLMMTSTYGNVNLLFKQLFFKKIRYTEHMCKCRAGGLRRTGQLNDGLSRATPTVTAHYPDTWSTVICHLGLKRLSYCFCYEPLHMT